MEQKKMVIGIMGLQFGLRHLEGAQANGCEIGAICDVLPERLKEFGDQYGIPEEKRFTDYHDALNVGLDAVVLAVPDQLHRQLTIDFLNAGIHVLCEKPLALNHEDLCAIVEAERTSKARFMVGQICRFTPAFVKVKEIIDSGKIGEIYYVESEYAHDYQHIITDLSNWRADPKRHCVVGGGCHAVDLMRWIAGDPYEITAYGTHKLMPIVPYDDATVAIMRFPNDVIGKVFVSCGCKRTGSGMRTQIFGTKGTILCTSNAKTITVWTTEEDGTVIKTPEEVEVEINDHNNKAEIAAFIDAIVNEKPIVTNAIEGAKSALACLSIVESAETHKTVFPDYSFSK